MEVAASSLGLTIRSARNVFTGEMLLSNGDDFKVRSSE